MTCFSQCLHLMPVYSKDINIIKKYQVWEEVFPTFNLIGEVEAHSADEALKIAKAVYGGAPAVSPKGTEH